MNIYAVSDLHLGFKENRDALDSASAHPQDWLILAGDIGETPEHLELAFDVLGRRFRQLVWVPGNHELWTVPALGTHLRGEAKYQQLVELCRAHGVLTPEDEFPVVEAGGERLRIAPLFLLYDYSFRPDHVPLASALEWAAASGVVCSDEHLLHTDPYPDVIAWCRARCDYSHRRLSACADGLPTVLINHFPLRQDLVWLPRIPRFSLWCGTRATEDWHLRFNARVVISGHLHVRSTQFRDQVRFEEVSLGYPRQWSGYTTLDQCIRRVV